MDKSAVTPPSTPPVQDPATIDQTPRAVVLSWSAGTPSNAPLTVSGPPQLVTTRSYMVPADSR